MIGPYVHVWIFALNMILIFLTHLIPSWITLTQLSWLTHWSRQLPLCCGPDIRLIIHCHHPCDHNCHHHQWHHYCKHYHPINDRNWWQYSKQTWITKTNNLKQGHRQSKIIDRNLCVAQLLLEVTWVRFLRRPTWPNTQTLRLEKWAEWSIKMRQKRKQERQRCVAATKHIFENVSKSIKAIV